MPSDSIKIRGARVHNLKNIDLDIPKGKLIVVTGLSGSGKSSLAFDTIYAEAERRFVESLSSYARQFLGVQDKPDVESIDGLSPAISIDQKSVSRNPRSTVGTITEIYDYLRILFARVGRPHCPLCGKSVGRQSVDEIVDRISHLQKSEIAILAPVISGKKGEHRGILEEVKAGGFLRVRLDGDVMPIDEAIDMSLDKQKKHSIEVVVDRFVISSDIERSRIADSVETALKISKGVAIVAASSPTGPSPRTLGQGSAQKKDHIFSEKFACVACGISLPDIEPRMFSFNSPYGACPNCTGIGNTLEIDPALVFPNKNLTLAEGAIRPWASASHRVGRQSWYWWMLSDLAERTHFSLNIPVKNLSQKVIDLILYGEPGGKAEGGFEGVVPNLQRRWKETDSEFTRAEIEKYMVIKICPVCNGRRLRSETLGVKIGDVNIADINQKTVDGLQTFFRELSLEGSQKIIATPLMKEIMKRLQFLADVGLHYLTLDRVSTSLSGGEAQRIRLATQIGSRLTGIIYILDEPSIGLHQRDQERLIKTLKDLRDLGNTVIVVEHDAQTIREADWVIDLGPGAGKHGGKVIFEGTPKDLLRSKTVTGDYLSGKKRIQISHEPEKSKGQKYITIKGAKEHNLKNVTVKIPLGKFVVVAGVSGSGKSSLINDILAKYLLVKFYDAHVYPGAHDKIEGTEHVDKVVVVDQSPIGRTPRSNPATYTGTFGHIRNLFSSLPEARARGFTPGRFSFNVKGGRCEVCEGQGVKKIEMYFLPDVYVECEECKGRRYNREALSIEYDGKNISQVLALTIEEALAIFKNIPAITKNLKTLFDVGLGYMKLGQSATTLSGGEAQRIKLATELSRRDTGKTLYILDEPTTGLHFSDIDKLLSILGALVERGNTVLVIEHNLDVIRNADHIVDLGPEGGDAGGYVVAEGTPAEVVKNKKSETGRWLAK
ncbi:MAG: excinuclease ABC subunit UvrA [bacterium]|nr:excinuclease ABC subunit UvrA [bacterium]